MTQAGLWLSLWAGEGVEVNDANLAILMEMVSEEGIRQALGTMSEEGLREALGIVNADAARENGGGEDGAHGSVDSRRGR